MVTTTRNLLTASWTADVQSFESAVSRFTLDRPLPNDCEVTFFEIAGDGHLHVNVTHRVPDDGGEWMGGTGAAAHRVCPQSEIRRHAAKSRYPADSEHGLCRAD